MIKFLQSKTDFPLTVLLGNKAPAWGLSRWGGDSGLRFVPPDDEGFSLRGDKRRLLYKGRRRSHRFTILGDGAFEYDVMLNKEPESNVICLRMEGADNYDFFRQPDCGKDPLIAGSYAVYKKETLIGEGTGKLCHIHRPEIIDARGRRCWGDLSVSGDKLCITIPEWWLSEATYPVVVDPVIGTTTVGSRNTFIDGWDEEELFYEVAIPVNRFLVQETINGACTAYVYTDKDDREAAGRPVLYSDSNNEPRNRRSANEALVDLRVAGGKPKGWRSGIFDAGGTNTSGSYIWFGVFTEYMWYPRFDYGARCYCAVWDEYDSIPEDYPESYYDDFKLSMYFTYTSAQNYVRKITQGVTLKDTRKPQVSYTRNIKQTVKPVTALERIRSYMRNIVDTTKSIDRRFLKGQFNRHVPDTASIPEHARKKARYRRKHTETVQADGALLRMLQLIIHIITGVFIRDYILRQFLIARENVKLKSCIIREIVLNSKIV